MKFTFIFGLILISAMAYADDVWLKGASVVDPLTKTIKKTDLHLVNGKVRRGTAPKAATAKVRIIDLAGKWIIPGLYDMHVHATFGNPGPGQSYQVAPPSEIAKIVLYAGVTGFLDLFAAEEEIFFAREQTRKDPKYADIYAAGPMFTCTKGHGTDLGRPTRVVNTPKEAEVQVRELAAKKPDAIKISMDRNIGPVLDMPTLKATIETARKLGIKNIVHIGTWADADDALRAGADVITHLGWTDVPDATLALMKEKKVMEIPTMTYQTELLHILENRRLLNAPLLLGMIPADLLAGYRGMDVPDRFTAHELEIQIRGRASFPVSLKKIVAAGIPVISGTDAGDLGVFHGYSIHREMSLLVDAGATTWDALASATSRAKAFLKRPLGIGEGELADLVVLGGNPIEDIANTQLVEKVFHRGVEIDRGAAVAGLKLSAK
jgi:imidazolonepropionase-like amidohydrolase